MYLAGRDLNLGRPNHKADSVHLLSAVLRTNGGQNRKFWVSI